MALQFTDENIKDYIESSRPTLVDCWATWCSPCLRMSPIIDELAADFGDKANIGKYNVDEESDLSQEFRIMSIPTLLFFKDGKLVNRMTGSQTKATLSETINSHL